MAINFLNNIEVDGEVQGTSLDINGDADISGATVMNGHLTLQSGGPHLILKDTTDDDDQQVHFANSSGGVDYRIHTADFTSAATGDGMFIGSTGSDPIALVTNDTTALTINTSQNATFAGTVTWSGGGSANANTAYGG